MVESHLGRLTLGPVTRERAARVLEQQLGAVWAAVLESHGLPAESGWRVVVGQLSLEPVEAPPNGLAPREEVTVGAEQ